MEKEHLSLNGRSMSKETARRTNLFLPTDRNPQIVAGYHNIADVLPGADPETRTSVSTYYDQRGWHIPVPRDRTTRMGLLIPNASDEAHAQVDYLRSISGKPIEAIDPRELAGKEALVIPYINTSAANESLQSLDVEIGGLPPRMTDRMKNKASSHELVARYEHDQFKVADFTVAKVENVAAATHMFLGQMETMYADVGLLEQYKTNNSFGVVLRPAESDGAYGNCKVIMKDDKWMVIKDGFPKPEEGHTNPKAALAEAQDYLKDSVNQNVEDRVVISRFLDVVDDPGMTVSIVGGHVFSWGWNSQLLAEGSKACIGTSTYANKDAYTNEIKDEYEDQMAEHYETFLRQLARDNDIDFGTIKAVANVDLMIPSPLEFELQRRRGQKPHLPIAEFNPRFTEFSDSVVGASLFKPLEQTTKDFQKVNKKGVATFAKYPLPEGTDPRDVRTELHEMYNGRSKDELVVVRMAPKPSEELEARTSPTMGLVIYGDKQKGELAIKEAIKNTLR